VCRSTPPWGGTGGGGGSDVARVVTAVYFGSLLNFEVDQK
jgi:GTPase involved in cell partitioning and DNA repair